jgi:chemotaxis signal transduction protein
VVDLRRMSGQAAFDGGSPAMLLINAGTATLALAVDEVLEIETPDASARAPSLPQADRSASAAGTFNSTRRARLH